MIVLECSDAGNIILQGPGAGRKPTASSVVSDIIDIIRNSEIKTFGRPYDNLKDAKVSDIPSEAPYFLRLLLDDKPGALARVTTTLGNEGISINRMRQYDHDSSKAPVLIVTHATSYGAVIKAITELPKTGVISSKPIILRIEE
jgi:homoserine dehydrogenase